MDNEIKDIKYFKDWDLRNLDKAMDKNLETAMVNNWHYTDAFWGEHFYLAEQSINDFSKYKQNIVYEITNRFENVPPFSSLEDMGLNEDDLHSDELIETWIIIKGGLKDFKLMITNEVGIDSDSIVTYNDITEHEKDNTWSTVIFHENNLSDLVADGFSYMFS